MGEETSDYEAELAALKNRCTELEARLGKAEETNEAGEAERSSELAGLHSALDSARTEMDKQAKMVEEARGHIVDMQARLKEQSADQEQNRAQAAANDYSAAEERVNDLHARVAEKDAQLESQLEETNETLRGITALESELAEARTEAQQEREKRTKAESHVTQFEERSAAAEETARCRDEHIAKLDGAAESSRKELDAERNAHTLTKERAERIEQQLETLRQERASGEEDLAAHEKRVQELDLELEELQQKLAAEQETQQADRKRLSELEADEAVAELRATTFEEQEKQARTRVTALEEELADARRNRETEIKTLNEQVSVLEQEKDALSQAADNAEGTINELRQALSTMEATASTDNEADSKSAEEYLQLETELSEQTRLTREITTHRDELLAALEAANALRLTQKEAQASLSEKFDTSQTKEKSAAMAHAEAQSALSAQEAALRGREKTIQQMQNEAKNLSAELYTLKNTHKRIHMGVASGAPDSDNAELEARDRQQRILLADMVLGGEKHPLGEILVRSGLVNEKQLWQALKQQRKNPEKLLGEILVNLEFAREGDIAQSIACQLGLRVVKPKAHDIDPETARLMTAEQCAWHVCVPLRVTKNHVIVAMANPLDETALKKIQDVTRRRVKTVVATPSNILKAIDDLYGAF